MTEEPIEIIQIDDLLKARRRCTMAAFPSWLGRLPALAIAVFSLTEGVLSFALHAAVASAVVAGYVLMLEGRVLGGFLQLGGIGALTLDYALSVQQLKNAIRASSPVSPPSMTPVWLFSGVVALFLLWGVLVTIRSQDVVPHRPLGKSARLSRAFVWRKAKARGLRRWRAIFLTGLLGGAIVVPLGIPALLLPRLETVYEYSTRTMLLGFLVYATYLGLSLTWAEMLIFKARRLAALDANSLLAIDRRQPSLLLRSFMDDLTPLTRKYESGRRYMAQVIGVTPATIDARRNGLRGSVRIRAGDRNRKAWRRSAASGRCETVPAHRELAGFRRRPHDAGAMDRHRSRKNRGTRRGIRPNPRARAGP